MTVQALAPDDHTLARPVVAVRPPGRGRMLSLTHFTDSVQVSESIRALPSLSPIMGASFFGTRRSTGEIEEGSARRHVPDR